MVISYLAILRRYPTVIAYGFLATFFSNFGQTFFMGLYSETFQNAFALSNTQFSAVYGGVTLASAVAILLVGHFIDSVRLRPYTATVCVAMGAGCLLMAHAPSLPLFVLGLWLVRFQGQAVMTHMSSTVTARAIHRGRGRSLSLTVLGQPVGEMVFPLLFALLAAQMDWRGIWQAYGLVCLLFVMPVLLWLAPSRTVELPDELETDPAAERKLHNVWRDPSMWLVLLACMFMPFVLTGIFFHQRWLMEDMGFSLRLYAFSFTAFGIGHAVAGLLSGSIVDRVGGANVLRVFLLPFIVATLVLASFGGPTLLPLFMLMAALSAGCTHTARGSFLAERYGVNQLGAVKSLYTSGMIFATAVSPVLFSYMIEATGRATSVLYLCAITGLIVCAALQFLKR